MINSCEAFLLALTYLLDIDTDEPDTVGCCYPGSCMHRKWYLFLHKWWLWEKYLISVWIRLWKQPGFRAGMPNTCATSTAHNADTSCSTPSCQCLFPAQQPNLAPSVHQLLTSNHTLVCNWQCLELKPRQGAVQC